MTCTLTAEHFDNTKKHFLHAFNFFGVWCISVNSILTNDPTIITKLLQHRPPASIASWTTPIFNNNDPVNDPS